MFTDFSHISKIQEEHLQNTWLVCNHFFFQLLLVWRKVTSYLKFCFVFRFYLSLLSMCHYLSMQDDHHTPGRKLLARHSFNKSRGKKWIWMFIERCLRYISTSLMIILLFNNRVPSPINILEVLRPCDMALNSWFRSPFSHRPNLWRLLWCNLVMSSCKNKKRFKSFIVSIMQLTADVWM